MKHPTVQEQQAAADRLARAERDRDALDWLLRKQPDGFQLAEILGLAGEGLPNPVCNHCGHPLPTLTGSRRCRRRSCPTNQQAVTT